MALANHTITPDDLKDPARRGLLLGLPSLGAALAAGSVNAAVASATLAELIERHRQAFLRWKASFDILEELYDQLPKPDVVLRRNCDGEPLEYAVYESQVNRYFDGLPTWALPKLEESRVRKLEQLKDYDRRRQEHGEAIGYFVAYQDEEDRSLALDNDWKAICAYVPTSFAEISTIAAYAISHVEARAKAEDLGLVGDFYDWHFETLFEAWAKAGAQA